MNNHRLFFSLILIFIIICTTSSSECNGHSNEDDVSFDIKVQQTPLILIGSSLKKSFDINIPNLFNVTFLVQCILKGPPTRQIIDIVQAGSLLGRRSCQRLNINQEYIVFLEPFFDGTYRSVDFEDIPYNNQMNILLEKTCGLSRIYPYMELNYPEASVLTNKCPSVVSIDCRLETPKTTVTKPTNIIDFEALSLLLAEHQGQNLSVAYFQDENHKTLFSDDQARANQASCMILISLVQLIFCNILHLVFIE